MPVGRWDRWQPGVTFKVLVKYRRILFILQRITDKIKWNNMLVSGRGKMKNILIGNGFNIEIGGMEYGNSAIIERLHKNIKYKDYGIHFGYKVTADDLEIIINEIEERILNNTLAGKYNNFCQRGDESSNLKRFLVNYDSKQSIGMEDYFLLLRLYHHSYNDPKELIRTIAIGLQKLLLDAIYNDGKIQNLYVSLTGERKKELNNALNQFNDIFTVNYDWNIEKVTERNVKHLHGQFNRLNPQFKSGTTVNAIAISQGITYAAREEDLHLFCNAIMGFSGTLKEETINIFNNLEADKDEYPIQDFKNLTGTLCLAGISPNNDDHIMKLIFENDKINEVIFYYHSKKDKDCAEALYGNQGIICKSVSELW